MQSNTSHGRPRRARNRRGEGIRLRQELIAAASALLDQTGSEDALSMRAVAREAGVAPQSVYLHFADKSELLWVVYANRWDEIVAALDAAAAEAESPIDELRARCRAYCDYAQHHPGQFRGLVAAAGQHPPEWDREPPGQRAFDTLSASVRSAAPPTQTDQATLRTTVCLIAAMNGLLQLHLNRPRFGWPPLDELVDEAISKLVGT